MNEEELKCYHRSLWRIMHKMFLDPNSESKEGLPHSLWFIGWVIKNLECDNRCGPHARNYMEKHPPEKSLKRFGGKGLFGWSVDFHNTVNVRQGKRTYDPQEVELIISQGCTDCRKDEGSSSSFGGKEGASSFGGKSKEAPSSVAGKKIKDEEDLAESFLKSIDITMI